MVDVSAKEAIEARLRDLFPHVLNTDAIGPMFVQLEILTALKDLQKILRDVLNSKGDRCPTK